MDGARAFGLADGREELVRFAHQGTTLVAFDPTGKRMATVAKGAPPLAHLQRPRA